MSDTESQDLDQEIDVLLGRKRVIDRQTDDYAIRKAKSGLFFGDDTRIEYLASQRFPNDKFGANKYLNYQGNLYYEDPQGTDLAQDGKKYSLEFPNNDMVGYWGDSISYIAPTATFAGDVIGGMAGAKKGFDAGMRLSAGVAHPYAKAAVVLGSTMAGGFSGNMAVGSVPRGARELLINGFYSEGADDLSNAYYDLLESSMYSLIPFGTGTAGTTRLAMKFRGKEDALQKIMDLGKDADVQERIKMAKEFGIDLTPAQATKVGNNARDIQYFMTRQPETRKILQYYDSQALQSEEALRLFADEIGSGKTVGDINTRIKKAGNFVMEELARRRKARGTKIYDILKEAPEGIKIDNMQKFIDLIDFKIAGKDVGPNHIPDEDTIKLMQKFKSLLYKDGDVEGELIDDLMSIHERRKGSIDKLISGIKKEGGDLEKIVTLKNELTEFMDATEPLYAQARRIYDPTKPSLQLVEKSVIGKFGKLMTDKQTATAMKNLFDPDVSIQSLRNARRLLQVADPDAFKDVKKQFILNTMERLTKQQQLTKGMPAVKNYFNQPKISSMMEEMLEPKEFETFNRLLKVMDDAFSIPAGGSPTQPLAAMEKEFRDEALGFGTRAAQNVLNVNKLMHLLTTRGAGDAITENIANNQYNRYLMNITNALTEDPDTFAKSMDEMANYFDKGTFRNKNIFLRGAGYIKDTVEEDSMQPYEGAQRRGEIEQQMDELLKNQTSSLDQMPSPVQAPAPMTTETDPATRMALAGDNPDNQMIAMRRSGLAGLV
jgi:hypothetical protein